MSEQEILNLIAKIKEELSALPVGCISKKTIYGKIRYYHQYKDASGKMKYVMLRDEEVDSLREQIEHRKELEFKLRRLSTSLPKVTAEYLIGPDDYECQTRIGKTLKTFVEPVKRWERRSDYSKLIAYLYGNEHDRVCVIYGLRRTGKSTMIRQAIADMKSEDFKRAAYIKIRTDDNMSMLNADLKRLEKNGFKYVFIDEVTLMSDFIDSASILSDIFAACGMKIVLSGTDSLGFWFALNNELYDRAKPVISTTFIPFGEFSRVLHIHSIDDYIRYGGTLRAGEVDFDDEDVFADDASFRDDETTRRYIDTAICKNIQHSLECYKDGSSFARLYELYEKKELTSAINRIIEDMNHRFVVDVLTREFVSHDLGLAKSNLNRERDQSKKTNILDIVDVNAITKRLKDLLDIKNKEEQSIGITETHVAEIKRYLKALDLIVDCPIEYGIGGERTEHIIFTQPGMRYCQAQALIYSLKKDEFFNVIEENTRQYVIERILEEIRGRMLEDIVLLETYRALDKRNYLVFKYSFGNGEFDMVVYDKKENSCKLYEIKHSTEIVREQARHLLNEEQLKNVSPKYGKITERCVLYRGKDAVTEEGILYKNVEDYLVGLSD